VLDNLGIYAYYRDGGFGATLRALLQRVRAHALAP